MPRQILPEGPDVQHKVLEASELPRVAQRMEHLATNQKDAGSNPAVGSMVREYDPARVTRSTRKQPSIGEALTGLIPTQWSEA